MTLSSNRLSVHWPTATASAVVTRTALLRDQTADLHTTLGEVALAERKSNGSAAPLAIRRQLDSLA